MVGSPPRVSGLWSWSSIALIKLLATLVVVAMGFTAISDDDFARIVIAQGFAAEPKLDASGSSWLPFPFWLLGSLMRLLSTDVVWARALSWVCSVGSALLLYRSALWCGLERRAAWLGAAIGSVIPHAVWLGVATVPDGFTAALCVFALASLSRSETSVRWLGVLAITCACLSRYEAWPVAATLTALGCRDALVQRRPQLALPAVVALLGPCLWLAHGVLHHDDMLFFVKRVAAYRRSLGRSPADVLSGLLGYPKVLLRAEPELIVGALLALHPAAKPLPHGLKRMLLGAVALLAFLMLGALRDGAPTHHPERPLLLVWLLAALLAGHAVSSLWPARRSWLYAGAVAVVGLFLLRPVVTRRDSFIDRSAELEIGALSRTVATAGKLLVDTGDYGYFAIIAGYRDVARAQPLEQYDPRQKRFEPWSSRESLLRRLRAAEARWLIAPRSRLAQFPDVGIPRVTTDQYQLVQVTQSSTAVSSPAPAPATRLQVR